MKTYKQYADQKVIFSKEDMAVIRHFHDPGFRVLGFKPFEAIPAWQNMRSPYFIYPDEKHMRGSSIAFGILASIRQAYN